MKSSGAACGKLWKPVCLAVLALLAATATSQERHDRRGPERFGAGERFRSPHWVYDDRYRHGHYYPAPGYAVASLPTGNLTIAFGGGRLHFHAGVWFRPQGPRYVVVRPPTGIIVPVLPPAYTIVWVGRVPYYYANDAYYAAAPGGYVVVAPPQNPATVQPAPAPPPAASAAQAATPAPQASAGNWYYCESAKGYYPYVTECKEGWRPVPATPVPPGAR